MSLVACCMLCIISRSQLLLCCLTTPADAKHVQSVLDRLQFVEGMHNGLLQSVGKAGEELQSSEGLLCCCVPCLALAAIQLR